ncbi:unnamed protein product [Medioppia subpectinata]|uniref:Uncharacterized protein n=1 Tax=Medioppia subpectinata TaxID=1979941 RepID=A0A7R9KT74_9ACAR|nr:unnamed protein product [Medioppia subpectinata]CAG2107985.1 unnamed protein product [Medioppia subpectinata]
MNCLVLVSLALCLTAAQLSYGASVEKRHIVGDLMHLLNPFGHCQSPPVQLIECQRKIIVEKCDKELLEAFNKVVFDPQITSNERQDCPKYKLGSKHCKSLQDFDYIMEVRPGVVPKPRPVDDSKPEPQISFSFRTPITAFPLVYKELINFCNITINPTNAANYTHLCAMITHVMRDHNIDLICIFPMGTHLNHDFLDPLVQNCLINYKQSADLKKLRTHCVNTLDQMFPTAQYVNKSLVSIHSSFSRYSDIGNYIYESVAIIRHTNTSILPNPINTLFFYKAYPYNKTILARFVSKDDLKPTILTFPGISNVYMCENKCLTKNLLFEIGTINSFTYVSVEIKTKECKQRLLDSDAYYNVCLYGYTSEKTSETTFAKTGLKAFPFYYTPNGMEAYKWEDYGYQNFCTELSAYIDRKISTGKTPDFRGLTAYQQSVDTKLYNIAVLWAASTDPLDNNQTVHTFKWTVDVKHSPGGKAPDINSMIEYNEVTNQLQSNDTINGLFVHNNHIVLNAFSGNQYFPIAVESIRTTNPQFQGDHYFKWDDIVYCPAKHMTYSVISSYTEGVCEVNRTYNKRQSVFNIGDRLYHQTGRHFYYYSFRDSSSERKFIFDKYVTQLLGTYFDTRQRVTGYSFKIHPLYKVVIHGKSSHAYRELGAYIYGFFDLHFPYYHIIPVEAHPHLAYTLGPALDAYKNQYKPFLSVYYLEEKYYLFMIHFADSDEIIYTETGNDPKLKVDKQLFYPFRNISADQFSKAKVYKSIDSGFTKIIGAFNKPFITGRLTTCPLLQRIFLYLDSCPLSFEGAIEDMYLIHISDFDRIFNLNKK